MAISVTTEKDDKLMIRSMGTAETLISNIESRDNLSPSEKNNKAYDIVDAVFEAINKKETLSGSGDDFHNFAVTLIRLSEDYETALEIIDLGLALHPSNTDLLSDAIKYGINCGKKETCEKRISELIRLPKALWTWRAYSFYIDYIMADLGNIKDASDNEIQRRIDDAIALSKDYQKYYPQLEDSWYSEYEIYRIVNDRTKAMELLKAIVEHKIESAPLLCPKSWLRYADINIEIGNSEEAKKYITKLRQTPESIDSVNYSYVCYLDGLCQMKELMLNDNYPEDLVKKAYKSFRLALTHKSLYSNLKIKIYDKIQLLEEMSEIKYPWEL